MKKSGQAQKSIKTKSDAVSSEEEAGEVKKELGDYQQADRQDRRKVKKPKQSTKVGSDPQ